MTSKTMKTMFFAGLIAAMILPFSGMDYAVAENLGNDKVKERNWTHTMKNSGTTNIEPSWPNTSTDEITFDYQSSGAT